MSAKPQRRILSPFERARLKDQIRVTEGRMQGHIDVPTNASINEQGLAERRRGYMERHMRTDISEDKALLKKNLDHLKRTLERGTPPSLSRDQRAKLEKQMAEDREFLKKNMTPKALYYAKANSPEFETAKQAVSREFKPDFQARAERFIQAKRALDPDDVERNNIEKLRPT